MHAPFYRRHPEPPSRVAWRLALLLSLGLCNATAEAHQDTPLHLRPADGRVLGLPARFGEVTLRITGLDRPNPRVTLRTNGDEYALPPCLTGMIKAARFDDVRVAGSWYRQPFWFGLWHTHEAYLSVLFLDPGFVKPMQSGPYAYTLMSFDLGDASLVDVKRSIVTTSNGAAASSEIHPDEWCRYRHGFDWRTFVTRLIGPAP